MTAADYTPAEEEQVFQAVSALPLAERHAYLDSACAGRPALRAAIERLLAPLSDDRFMRRSADRTETVEMAGDLARFKPEEVGDMVGSYKLLQKIGEGGFGVVWMAEQEKPVRRRVALKIIKLGMDTKEVIARFEQERQALAIMDHPNIARVIDAGSTPLGRPYFAMELVRGVKITEYCDQASLSTVDRLKLFTAVCHAVQHAHQKGIIHRDLKPSNILVTLHDGVPVPKVIDFGVAKATQQQRLTDLTLFTQYEQMVGTPLYMSPEQAELSGLDIDTRSDIYSLGVLLYELLTGRTPFDPQDLMRKGLDEIRRVIREQEPQKPSTFISTLALDVRTAVARQRQADGAKLSGQIRGDLDWIVMKALEKDRNRRYDTASSFARDIERHLASEPVQARPPSQLYRFRRFAKRNKVAFAAGSAVAAAVLIGLGVSIWQATRANAALAELRASAPAFAAQARGLAGRERYDEAIEKLEYAIKLRPDAVEYLLSKADLLECQFRFKEAAPIYRAALRLSPGDPRAQANLTLCEELQAEQVKQPNLARESLIRIVEVMTREDRSAAEMLPVSRLLGQENKLVLAAWLDRLKELPIQPKRPLEELLTMGNDGMLKLDLSGTPISDLSLLEGMPLGWLSLARCIDLSDLRPLAGLPLDFLDLEATKISDLGPLSKMRTLTHLNVAGSRVRDLSPLKDLRLLHLNLNETRVVDLSPLREMLVHQLMMNYTRISDLTPLSRMPLYFLSCDAIPAIDFTPLAACPIHVFYLQGTGVGDLSFLRKMPLEVLVLNGCGNARGFQVLNEISSLELLGLPDLPAMFEEGEMTAIDALRTHPGLRQIQLGNFKPGTSLNAASTADEFWKEWDVQTRLTRAALKAGVKTFGQRRLKDGTLNLSFSGQPLRDVGILRDEPVSELVLDKTLVTDLAPLAEKPLRHLLIRETAVSDLSFLRASRCGSTIEHLWLWHTKVTDFSPLAECPALWLLDLNETAITDLEPLRGLKLRTLYLLKTRVTDLSPLAGAPLETVLFDGTDVTDIAPLLQCPTLEKIILPTGVQNVDLLRGLPKLRKISYEHNPRDPFEPSLTADEFWAAQDIEKEKAQKP